MRKVLGVLLVVLFAVTTSLSASEQVYGYIPTDVDVITYPFLTGPLTAKQAADYGLTPFNLDRLTPVRNWHRSQHRFVEEVLSAGTTVWVDQNGTLVYKHSCGNRIAPLPAVAKAATPPAPAKASLLEDLMLLWNALPWSLATLIGVSTMLALFALAFWLLTLLVGAIASLLAAVRRARRLPEDGTITIRGGQHVTDNVPDGIIVRWRNANDVRMTDDRIR